jgi:putative membrane protein (TIGR04086 family)
MATAATPIRWSRIALAGELAPVLSLVLVTLIVTVYAAYLAIQARGQPDMTLINRFAAQVAPWATPALTIVLTALGASLVARLAPARPQLHGTLIGVVAALLSLLLSLISSRALTLQSLLAAALIVGAGWVGGFVAGRSRRNRVASA